MHGCLHGEDGDGEVVTQCMLQTVEAKERYKPISFMVCTFSSFNISFPMVPVLLKTATGGRSVVWRSQPGGFLLGTFSLLAGDGSWRNYSLLRDSHRSRQTTRWPHTLSLYSIPLFLLLGVGDPLWSL